MSRAEFPKSVRRDAFARANGRCEEPECGRKLFPGEAEYHHAKEDFLGGEPTLENVRVLCRRCHSAITKAQRPMIDKTRRLSDKRMGIRKRSTFPGSRDSRFKRKISGEVVLR